MVTRDDVARASTIPRQECPRRYCWYWQSFGFAWDVSIAQGCTWLKSKSPVALNQDTPCLRADSSSPFDHYESRAPYLMEDGFIATRWFAIPPIAAKQQHDLLLSKLRAAGWTDDGVYLWAPHRTTCQIIGFPYWGPSASRPRSVREYLAMILDTVAALKMKVTQSSDALLRQRLDDRQSLSTVLERLVNEEKW